MSVIMTLVFGAMAGGVAKWLYPGRGPTGWLPTIALGIVGSVVGGLPFGGHPAGLVFSILGAVAVLVAYRIWESRNDEV